MRALARLQESLRAEVAGDRERVVVPGFDAYVDHLRTQKYYSLALPDSDAGAEHLPALRQAFSERGRNARIELFPALNPELESVLLAHGWTLSERMPVMTCTPDALIAPPPVGGLRVEPVRSDSPEDLVLGFMRAQRIAFRDDTPITDEQVTGWRAHGGWRAAGLLGETIAGTALCGVSFDGIAEVGGVATPPEFRRRGIAAAVTHAAVAAAFADGLELAWLTAAADDSRRIYERMGFETVGTLLAYDAPSGD